MGLLGIVLWMAMQGQTITLHGTVPSCSSAGIDETCVVEGPQVTGCFGIQPTSESICFSGHWLTPAHMPKVDVPAIQGECVNRVNSCDSATGKWCRSDCANYSWTCTDKSRVLLTSENGKKHCVKF